MPYIVKSSLDIGGKIIPWNEQEVNKLIKEKEEALEVKKIETSEQVSEQVQDAKVEKNAPKEKQDADVRFKKNKKKDKVGEE